MMVLPLVYNQNLNNNHMAHHENNQLNVMLASKQAYLRTHVPNHHYQDFAQYCQSVVGNVDIESWELEYMKQLVQAFLLSQQQREAQNIKCKDKNHTYHLYQTGDSKDIKALAQDIKQQHNKNHQHSPNNQKHQSQGAKMLPREKQQKSALQFLDRMVERQDKVVERQDRVVDRHDKARFESKKYDKSFFQSGRIWEVPAIEQVSAKAVLENVATNKRESVSAASNMVQNKSSFEEMFRTLKSGEQTKVIKSQMDVEMLKPMPKNQRVFQQIAVEEQNQNKSKIRADQDKPNRIKIVDIKPIKKANKIPYDCQTLIKNNFTARIACFKSFERTALSFRELRVQIEEHEVVNRFLSSDYVMYHLRVVPSNVTCKRNLQDFFKLRKQMQSIYPGIRLPYLQKVGWLQSQLKSDVIAKQKKFLTYFLRDLLSHPELRNSRILEDFLTFKDHKLIKRKFQQYQKLKQISSIEQLCLLEGQVKVELTQQNRQYNEHSEYLTLRLKRLLDDKDELLVKIQELHRLMVEHYQRLSELSSEMGKQIAQFNKKVSIKQIGFLSDTFTNLITYAQSNVTIHNNESKFLKEDIIPFIRYQRQNIATISPLFATSRQLLSAYLKQKDSDTQNIEYLSERLSPFKEHILSQSKSGVVVKYQCGYLQSCLVDGTFHYFQVLSRQLQGLLSDVCYKKLSGLSQTINTLTTLVYS